MKERISVPGENLGVIEEYIPGKNVYVENGILHSEIIGLKRVIDKFFTIEPFIKIKYPRKGMDVIAEVLNTGGSTAYLEIQALIDPKIELIRKPLPAFMIKPRTVNWSMKVADLVFCKVRDIVNGKIIVYFPRIPKYGVLYGLCSKCKQPLSRRGRTLECPSCGSIYIDRRISTLYGDISSLL